VLPLAAAGVPLAFGAKRRWRGRTLAWSIATIAVVGGLLEMSVLFLEIVAHNCTQ
jgi:hypothetical protein